MNVFANFRRTSGAIFGTFSQYSPISQRIDARAAATVMKSINFAICEMISKWSAAFV